jgi:hypothetical protein
MERSIIIEFNEDKYDLHDDLSLSIPSKGIKFTADSYYFSDDESIVINNDESERKYDSVKQLLNQWKRKIESMEIGDICFLPFDFSDEYIGCLKLELVDQWLVGNYGYTEKIHGYAIYPSNLSQFAIGNEDFIKYSEEFKLEKQLFIYSVEQSISNIQVK